jgi:hypothetical protein
MLRPKPVLNPKQMLSQRQNIHNHPQLEIAIQWMVEVHTEMTRILTQNMVNRDSKELPSGMQQLLDDHS